MTTTEVSILLFQLKTAMLSFFAPNSCLLVRRRFISRSVLHVSPHRCRRLGCCSGSPTADLSVWHQTPRYTETNLETQGTKHQLRNTMKINEIFKRLSGLLLMHSPSSMPLTQSPLAMPLDACMVADRVSRRVTALSSRSIKPSMMANLEKEWEPSLKLLCVLK